MSAPGIIRQGTGALCAVALVVLISGLPAGAHTGYLTPSATNLRTTISAVSLPVRGVEARVVDLGDQLELRGIPAADLIVVGYQDEPFVASRPDGIYVNTRSPSALGDANVADLVTDADPAALPSWVRIGGPGVLRWHDHRAHWMGVGDPPAAIDAPGDEHVIVDRWVVPVVAGGDRGEIIGELTWEPPPSPYPWLGLGLVVMLALLGPLVARRGRMAVVASGTVLAVSTLALACGWIIDGGATVVQVFAVAGPVMVGVGLLAVLCRQARPQAARSHRRRLALLGLVALALVFTPVAPMVVSGPFGSQLASAWPPTMTRVLAAIVAGSSVGLLFTLLALVTTPSRSGTGGPGRRRPILLTRQPGGR